MERDRRRLPRFADLTPGILVAATGVGAGDLLTASIAGSAVGLTVLWAAWAGAVLKYYLNEGVARWQMATGTTLLEGWTTRLSPWVGRAFLAYLLLWSFLVGGALISACGLAGAALLPLGDDVAVSKQVWGVVHALAGALLVRLGGFRLFERVMAACIGVMFVAVLVTAILLRPEAGPLLRGLLVPRLPGQGVAWLLGVLGGVGGTVTLLSYGYWIREKGRRGAAGLAGCRLDLKVGYTMTALFGLAMIVIGSRVEITKGPGVVFELAGQLELALGPAGRWVFLVGFWGAVFSSLLGVWQSVPYLFADFVCLRGAQRVERLERTAPYRLFLVGLAIVPLPVLWLPIQRAQLLYAVSGALFMPFLAVTLLAMNNRRSWVGALANRRVNNLVLLATAVFFALVIGYRVAAHGS